MSSLQKLINDAIGEKLKGLHCAFIAKVLSVNNNKAKIQPLGLTKDYGKAAKAQAVISDVHIAQSAMNKLSTKEIEYVDPRGGSKNAEIVIATPIDCGDIVLCVCCDRNIDAALKGRNELPPVGYHNKSDCVIVAII